MKTAVNYRRMGRWVLLVYPVLWAPLRLLYVATNHVYGTDTLEGGLSRTWWLLVLLYFLADVLLALGVKSLSRMFTVNDNSVQEPFWYTVSEIIPIWFLLHLAQLFLEYPVSARLESVGLGKLEGVVLAAPMIAAVAYVLRLTDRRERPTIDQVPSSRRAKIALYSALILVVCILLAIPYFATRPLSRDAIIHATERR